MISLRRWRDYAHNRRALCTHDDAIDTSQYMPMQQWKPQILACSPLIKHHADACASQGNTTPTAFRRATRPTRAYLTTGKPLPRDCRSAKRAVSRRSFARFTPISRRRHARFCFGGVAASSTRACFAAAAFSIDKMMIYDDFRHDTTGATCRRRRRLARGAGKPFSSHMPRRPAFMKISRAELFNTASRAHDSFRLHHESPLR